MLWVIKYIKLPGIVELILTAPELVDAGLVEELEQIMSSSASASSQDTSQACLYLSASVATAFLYYKTGQVPYGRIFFCITIYKSLELVLIKIFFLNPYCCVAVQSWCEAGSRSPPIGGSGQAYHKDHRGGDTGAPCGLLVCLAPSLAAASSLSPPSTLLLPGTPCLQTG